MVVESMNHCANYVAHYEIDGNEFDYFNNKDRQASAFDVLFRKFVARLAGDQKVVVDVGSGAGWTAMIPHEQMVFIDLSKKNLQNLISPEAFAIVSDAHRLPLKDESVGFVIASEVFEHLNNPSVAAAEIMRVLKHGGRAIITTPYKEKIRYTLCIHCNKLTPWNSHLHSFDSQKLSAMFTTRRKRTYLLGSKLFSLIRIYPLLNKLPFKIWRALDWTVNKLLDKAAYIVLVIDK